MKTRIQYRATLASLAVLVALFLSASCSLLSGAFSAPYSNMRDGVFVVDFQDSRSVWAATMEYARITGIKVYATAPPEPFTENRAKAFCDAFLMEYVNLEPNGWVIRCRRV